MPAEIIPVLHNVSSVQRVVDMARLAYGLGIDTLVVTKAYGGAAQSGVPEAMRIAMRENKRFIVLPDLADAVSLLNPDTVLLVTRDYNPEPLSIAQPPRYDGRVIVAFSGSEPDFTPSEASMGKPVYPAGVPGRLGTLAEAALVLYALRRSAES